MFGENVGDVELAGAMSCDAEETVTAFEESPVLGFCSEAAMALRTYARVSGPKYPVAGSPCVDWYLMSA